MNKELYLVRIFTTKGKTLYIDDTAGVWSEASLNSCYDSDGIVYITDLKDAKESAYFYGGEVVRVLKTVEKVDI